jgi:hypothetical protein
MEKTMRLKGKGVYKLTHSVDPGIISWENTGAPMKHKLKIWIEIYSYAFLLFLITFIGFWGVQLFEKLRNTYEMSNCSGNDSYNIEDAYLDFNLPRKENQMQGLMACYCK